jgi:hypothetical protein
LVAGFVPVLVPVEENALLLLLFPVVFLLGVAVRPGFGCASAVKEIPSKAKKRIVLIRDFVSLNVQLSRLTHQSSNTPNFPVLKS